jgi:hypothetical protein
MVSGARASPSFVALEKNIVKVASAELKYGAEFNALVQKADEGMTEDFA